MSHLNILHVYTTYLDNTIKFWGDVCKKYMLPLLIVQKAVIRLIGGAKYQNHYKPIAKRLNLLLLDYLHFISVISFMHKIHYNSCCDYLLITFSKNTAIHSHNTRSCTFNFRLLSASKTVGKNL